MPGTPGTEKGTPRIVIWGGAATDKNFRKALFENPDKAFQIYDLNKVRASEKDLTDNREEIYKLLKKGGDKLRDALAAVEQIVCSLDTPGEESCEEVPQKIEKPPSPKPATDNP
jgi:hypothetical protein